MADQVQTPVSGGGEAAQPSPQPEINKENVEQIKETKTEVPTEIQPDISKEIKPEESQCAKPDTALVNPEPPKEVKSEEVKQVAEASGATVEATVGSKQSTIEANAESNCVAEIALAPKDEGDWQQRETELLKKIDELEKVKKERTQDSLLLELKVREEEIDLLKARVKNLETELQAALSKPSGKNHEMIEKIKQQHEELLSKARGMIFDKTKMVKNQELQIEALNSQVISLKDINQITKDLLEIRNSEIKAMEDRLHAMEARFKAEKERYGLVLERAQTSSNINDDLRKEYETQLALFKQLREKYDQRVQALVAENEKLKGSIPQATNGADAGTSG